jgi:hypothetical protein
VRAGDGIRIDAIARRCHVHSATRRRGRVLPPDGGTDRTDDDITDDENPDDERTDGGTDGGTVGGARGRRRPTSRRITRSGRRRCRRRLLPLLSRGLPWEEFLLLL